MTYTKEPDNILFPTNKAQFNQMMKGLRANLYSLIDVLADSVVLSKADRLVKVRFPNTEGI